MRNIYALFLILTVFTPFLTLNDDQVYFGVSRYDLLINKNYTKEILDIFFRDNAYRGANWTRVYSYFYGPFNYGGSLFGGFPNTYIPWKVVSEESNNRKIFDLTQFSSEYEERLKWFIDVAKYYEITVDLCIFDTVAFRFDETWKYHPFNPSNNIQGFNGRYAGLPWNVDRQYFTIYIKWLAEKLKDYENLVIELVNEGYPDNTGDMDVYRSFLAWEYDLVRQEFPGKKILLSTEAPGLFHIYCDIFDAHFIWGRSALYREEGGITVLRYLEGIPRPKVLSSDGDGNPTKVWEVITQKNEGEIIGLYEEAFSRRWGVDLTTLDYTKSYWVVDAGAEVYKSIFGVYPKNWHVKKTSFILPNFSDPKYNYLAIDKYSIVGGQTINFTVNYKNTGAQATGVSIKIKPSQYFEKIIPGNGGTFSGENIIWNIGNVGSGEGGSVSFKARLKVGTPIGTKIQHLAEIDSDQTDPYQTNKVIIYVIF
ncbi:MAG: hypothetical protein ACUVUG_10170 [Candidatus Aminicenantia bacterium]